MKNCLYVLACVVPYIFLLGMLCMDKEKKMATWQYCLVIVLLFIPAFIAGWFVHKIYLIG